MREGFPKLSVAMDGDSQASQGRAARSVFQKHPSAESRLPIQILNFYIYAAQDGPP